MMGSIFSDKASLILRAMLGSPHKAWVVRDFVQKLALGRGWAAEVLSVLRQKGYVQGECRGRAASSTLRNAEELVQSWTRYYTFDLNHYSAYYSPDSNVLPRLKQFFKKYPGKETYALTLHAGANLITNFVRDSNIYLYLNPDHFEKISLDLRQALDLKELKSGGNVYLVYPHYKSSTFFGLQKIRGYWVVSNLQLYLDLYHFPQRGREHADYLLRRLREEGRGLA